MRGFLIKSIVLLALAGVFSVASSDNTEVSPDTKALTERVKKRWQAFSVDDFLSVYGFQTPAYRRAFPKGLFVSSYHRDIKWEFQNIESVEFDEESKVATVIVNIITSSVNPLFGNGKGTEIPTKITEKWLHIKQRWWHSSSK